MGERGLSVHALGTSRTDKKHGYFRALLKTRKQNCGKRYKKETSEDAGSGFTTYHRHHRHPVGRRRQRTSVRTGSALDRKHGRFHSPACCLSTGRRSDHVNHRHSRTWKNHHIRFPRSADPETVH